MIIVFRGRTGDPTGYKLFLSPIFVYITRNSCVISLENSPARITKVNNYKKFLSSKLVLISPSVPTLYLLMILFVRNPLKSDKQSKDNLLLKSLSF